MRIIALVERNVCELAHTNSVFCADAPNSRRSAHEYPNGRGLRIFPGLVRLVLPQGVFDIEGNIPPNDVTLLATTNRLLIRDDLHPEIVQLLLRTVSEVHGKQDIFQRAGEFPTQTDPEYSMAASAVDYYKNGPSFLQRHLPLWLGVHVQRAIAVLVAAIAIGIPLLNLAPKLYRWFLDDHMRKLYRRLRTIEEASQTELTTPQPSKPNWRTSITR